MTNKELYSAMLVITAERAKHALGVGDLEPRDIYTEITQNLAECLKGDSSPTRALVQIWAERFAYCTSCNCFNAADCSCLANYDNECALLCKEQFENEQARNTRLDPLG